MGLVLMATVPLNTAKSNLGTYVEAMTGLAPAWLTPGLDAVVFWIGILALALVADIAFLRWCAKKDSAPKNAAHAGCLASTSRRMPEASTMRLALVHARGDAKSSSDPQNVDGNVIASPRLQYQVNNEKYTALAECDDFGHWRTISVAIHNDSETKSLENVEVKITRWNPMPYSLRGNLPVRLRFRNEREDVTHLSIQPKQWVHVDVLSWHPFHLANLRIEHTAQRVAKYIMGGETAQEKPASFNDLSDNYTFDLTITATGYKPIVESFNVVIYRAIGEHVASNDVTMEWLRRSV
jgi:hypothetical protein